MLSVAAYLLDFYTASKRKQRLILNPTTHNYLTQMGNLHKNNNTPYPR